MNSLTVSFAICWNLILPAQGYELKFERYSFVLMIVFVDSRRPLAFCTNRTNKRYGIELSFFVKFIEKALAPPLVW